MIVSDRAAQTCMRCVARGYLHNCHVWLVIPLGPEPGAPLCINICDDEVDVLLDGVRLGTLLAHRAARRGLALPGLFEPSLSGRKGRLKHHGMRNVGVGDRYRRACTSGSRTTTGG